MKYCIITYGCQMNEADSRLMAAVLDQAGWEEQSTPQDADLVIVNTCSVRQKPEQKVRSLLGELRENKLDHPQMVIAVVGCMAQKDGYNLVKQSHHIDLVLGTRCFHRILNAVERVRAGERPLVLTNLDDDPATIRCDLKPRQTSLRAFVPIILGCTNFCSYCIVPYVRGKETSRPTSEIVREVEELASQGTREVTLLGQNVLAWGKEISAGMGMPTLQNSSPFAKLLYELNEIHGPWRIRFTTCHPRDVDAELIDALATLPKVCEHIHLPVQAGNDKLLQEMNRGYSTAHYKKIVEELRASVPGIAITTDIMVGFPGETDEEFEQSLAFYQQIGFDAAFTFAYSLRPGTVAADRPDQVPPQIRRERLQKLIALQNRITIAHNQREVGRVVEVLVDGPAEKGEELLAGKSRQNKHVVFAGERDLVGSLVQVKLIEALLWGFRGSMAI